MFNIKEFATHDEYVVYTANTGDFITPNVSYCRKKRECHFTSKQPQRDYTHDYLTFVALEDGTFNFSKNSINYSLDSGQTWVSLASNTNTPTVSAGNTIMWKMSGITPSSSSSSGYGIGKFSSSAKFAVQGNAMSIVSGDSFDGASAISDYQFYGLFSGCTGLVGAKNLYLPSTTLADYCYESMFQNCTSLTTAPELPATTLAQYCYRYMFNGCTSLTTAPELPATTLVTDCYSSMLRFCSNLNYIKALFTTTPSSTYTYDWVCGVASSGTFVKNSSATWDVSGNHGIPEGWTIETANS